MSQIFISYSRVDTKFVEQLLKRLQRSFPEMDIWLDQGHHGILGGDDWWAEILKSIAESDIFIYVLSNESVQSAYCQAEFKEAQRLQKNIITIQARDRTALSPELSNIQYVDMKNGVDDVEAITILVASVNKQLRQVKKNPKPLSKTATAKPKEAKEAEKTEREDVTTPDLKAIPVPKQESGLTQNQVAIIVALITVAGTIIAALIQSGFFSQNNTPTNTPQATTQVAIVVSETATNATPSQTLDATEMEATIRAEMLAIGTEAQGTIDANFTLTPVIATVQAQQTSYQEATQNANATSTATLWTATPTPDTRKTAEARVTLDAANTQSAATSTQAVLNTQVAATSIQSALNSQATSTQSVFNTQSAATSTQAALNTQVAMINATATVTNAPDYPLQEALRLANTPMNLNIDWEVLYPHGFVWEFDNVPMVLVPAGCFTIGSDNNDAERNGTEICFEEPFWIDQTEVTQAQFETFGGIAEQESAFTGDNRPVERITWFEARTYCEEKRGGSLPTEAQWEYAARGVDTLFYPWGNDWNTNNAVWYRSTTQGTAEVGSVLWGESWVGALDLSGNVWEWTSSLYRPYPYSDLSENMDSIDGRILRGGAWSNTSMHNLRSSTRNIKLPNEWNYSIGFRCAAAFSPES